MPFDGSSRPTLASQLRGLLGPNGEHWTQWDYKTVDENGHVRFCLIGGIEHITRGRMPDQENAVSLLSTILGNDIEMFNDTAISFATIVQALDKLEEWEMTHAV